MAFKMNGSPAKMGTIKGTAGHSSALKMKTSALKETEEKAYGGTKTWKEGDKAAGGNLDEMVKARGKHKKGTPEYNALQNKINESLGSKVRRSTEVDGKGPENTKKTTVVDNKGTKDKKDDTKTTSDKVKGVGRKKGKTLDYTEKEVEKVKVDKANKQIKEGKKEKNKDKRDKGQLEKAEIKSGRDNKKTGTVGYRNLAKRKNKRNKRQLEKRAAKNKEA